MSTTLANRMNSLTGSASAAVMSKVTQLRLAGRDIISLNVGEPDFPTPGNIKEAGIRAIREDRTKYTPAAGTGELREAIAAKLRSENGISCTADHIAVCVGAKEAISAALMAVAGPGDEVIIPCPCYVSYAELVRMAGALPVFVETDPDTYALDPDAVERAVTPRTKAIIICTPCNPTGAVYSEAQLRALADLALRYDFFILTDEIYEKLVYDGARHFSAASISEEVRDHCITINGFSKTYAMTGWRIGYAAARKDVTAAVIRIISQLTTCVCSISQEAALEALRGSQADVPLMRAEFQRRRDYMVQRLRGIPGIICPDAQGAFYLLFDVRAYFGTRYGDFVIRDDTSLCEYLLEEGNVAAMPGTDYRAPGRLRISYAASMEALTQAADRMEAALARLQ